LALALENIFDLFVQGVMVNAMTANIYWLRQIGKCLFLTDSSIIL